MKYDPGSSIWLFAIMCLKAFQMPKHCSLLSTQRACACMYLIQRLWNSFWLKVNNLTLFHYSELRLGRSTCKLRVCPQAHFLFAVKVWYNTHIAADTQICLSVSHLILSPFVKQCSWQSTHCGPCSTTSARDYNTSKKVDYLLWAKLQTKARKA